MAKLSLWLLTLAKDKPFEFLDHSIRCGDSLVGLHSIDQLKYFCLKPEGDDEAKFFGPLLGGVEEAITLRLKIEDLPANSVEDIERQEKLLREAYEKIARLRCAADLLVAGEFWGEGSKDKQEKVRHAAVKAGYYLEKGPTKEFEQVAAKERRGQKMFHWPLEFPEVIVKRGGFDAFVGNPPFIKGSFISGYFGTQYRLFIQSIVAHGKKGNADFSAFFLLRASSLACPRGMVGLILTNSIAEGDTREVGLEQVLENGFSVIRAIPTLPWPGTAILQVALLWSSSFQWKGLLHLGDNSVRHITAYLEEDDSSFTTPSRLSDNLNLSYTGNKVYGEGFVLSPQVADDLLKQSPANSKVVLPYVKSEDLLASPDQTYSSWVINFGEMSLAEARQYPACIEIVERLVKPYRDKVKEKKTRDLWWLHERRRPELYTAIQGMSRVLFHGFTCKFLAFSFVPANVVFAAPHVILLLDGWADFAVLQSSIHEAWVRQFGSVLRDAATGMRYPASDVFQTFARPVSSEKSETIGQLYYSERSRFMKTRSEGLTEFYNRFHDPDESSADIRKVRELHGEMDQAVVAAYGWTDLELGHGFHETKQGVRFAICEPARREVLQRLMKLNHERYADEMKQGLHGKKGTTKKAVPKKKAASKSAKQEASLFNEEDDE